ncbi:MAG: zinc ribbon domain-containing protein [Clostridiales bacterium]|nr:zinc ribbon domain-containing protein [Clostridiales bacterium]
MKYCPNCHLSYDDNASVCGRCGGQLTYYPDQNQYQQTAAYDPTDHTAEYDPKDISDNKVFAMLPYIMSMIGVVIALLAAQSSPYTMFHVRQGLKLQVVSIIVGVIGAIIPILGWIAIGICAVIILVVEIICFINVCKGKAKEAPIVNGFGFLK